MAHISFPRKHTPSDSYIYQTFIDNRDSGAGSRRRILWSSFSDGIITSLTTGVYFTGLMLAMGAGETYIAYTAVIISFSGLFQLLTPLLLERFPRRKPLLIAAKALYHLLNIVVMGVLPLLPIPGPVKLALFLVTLLLMHAANYLALPGISVWHTQSLPLEKRVHYYTVSNMGTSVLNKVSAFLAGLLLDRFELEALSLGQISPTVSAIMLLRAGALVFAALELFCYLGIREFPYEAPPDKFGQNGLGLLLIPFKDRLFLKTILPAVIYFFIAGIVGSYFNIYLLEDVKMSYSLISLAGFLSVPVTLLATPLWHRAISRQPWPRLLAMAQLINALAYTLNAFITPGTLYIYFLCIIIGTFCAACVNIMHPNLVYLNMPAANRTAYYSLYSIAQLLATFLGNNVGILFVNLIGERQITLLGFQMGSKQCVNLLSALLFVCLALLILSYGRKKEFNIRVLK